MIHIATNILRVKIKVLTSLTPWSRVLPEKLTLTQPVKEFPVFYGTQRLIIAFTSARHLSLSSARSIQSMPPHSTSWIPILYYPPINAQVFQVVSFDQVFSPNPCIPLSCLLHAPPNPFFWFYCPNNVWCGVEDLLQHIYPNKKKSTISPCFFFSFQNKICATISRCTFTVPNNKHVMSHHYMPVLAQRGGTGV